MSIPKELCRCPWSARAAPQSWSGQPNIALNFKDLEGRLFAGRSLERGVPAQVPKGGLLWSDKGALCSCPGLRFAVCGLRRFVRFGPGFIACLRVL
jgi:hypothetical protein